MNYKYIAVISSVLFPLTVLAQPTVSGGTISIPDDGYYQVQRSDDYSIVCEGVRSCDVPPGNYKVINLSTGEKFRNVIVGEATTPTPTPSGTPIQVSGNTLSWPDDGWYQVQTANGVTVCEGGLSCEVPDGTYKVINHSTGVKYRNIQVGGSNPAPEPNPTPDPVPVPTAVAVNGNTISWPDDGWYQVQSSADGSTVCEGGLSCDVPDGIYKVINHSTGDKFRDIQVGGSNPAPGPNPDPDPVPTGLTVNGNTISWPDDGWYQVQNESNYASVCEGGTSCVVPAGTYRVINHSTGERFDSFTVGNGPQNPNPSTTPENAVIAGVPYEVARVWLNNVVTGRHLYTGNSFDSYIAFAIAPSVVGNLVDGSTNNCVGGGTVSYQETADSVSNGFASFSSLQQTYNYTNCVLLEGTIDGSVTVTTYDSPSTQRLTTDFNVATSQPANLPTISATLNGQRIVETISSAVFNPICGMTTTEGETEYALSLNNSTLTESNTGGLESHYYATLDHSQTDHTRTDCDGEASYTRYSSTANYTHSSSNGSEVVDAAKTGDVVSDSDDFNELNDASIASLTATILAPDSTLITMMIDASDSLGSSLEVDIDNGQDRIEFTENLNFRELSAQ